MNFVSMKGPRQLDFIGTVSPSRQQKLRRIAPVHESASYHAHLRDFAHAERAESAHVLSSKQTDLIGSNSYVALQVIANPNAAYNDNFTKVDKSEQSMLTAGIEMQSIEESAEEEDSAFAQTDRSRHVSVPMKHVTVSSPSREPPAQVLTTINMPSSGANGNGTGGWLPGWTNTVSVINKPVQCRAVVCRQRKISGVMSTASAIGLSSSVYYERMHRRRSSAVSQGSSASASRAQTSGTELQKIASVSSASSTPQLNAEHGRMGSASNLAGSPAGAYVSLDGDPAMRSRRATTCAKWLVAPTPGSAPLCETQDASGSGYGPVSGILPGSLDTGALGDEADCDREGTALLTPTQTQDSAPSFPRASLERQLTPQGRAASGEDVEGGQAVRSEGTDKQERRARVRTVLHQQSAEVAGYKFAYKLSRRDALLAKRRVIAMCALWLAMFGLVMVVVESELMLNELLSVWERAPPPRSGVNLTEQYIEALLAFKSGGHSQLFKMLTSMSTVCLLVCIMADRVVLLELFKINNSIADWHLVLTPKWLYQLCLELAVCAIHPLPFWSGGVVLRWQALPTARNTDTLRVAPLDVLLTLPMLLRLYLIFRVIVAYSRHTARASSHSISALNRIHVDAKFILKTTVIVYPGTLLFGFIAVFWITASWCLRLCECFHDAEFLDFWNSAWLTAVTFFSIGYGDIVPTTGCGRSVAILTGLTGAGCIAFVVAVLARKIELSKAELYMHNFLRDMRITNSLKNTAANVLRETWLIHKYSNPDKPRVPRVRLHERKFFHAIQKLRRIKVQQRELMDSATALIDITPLHSQLSAVIDSVQDDQLQIYDKLGVLEQKFGQMCSVLETLPVALQQVSNGNNNSYNKNSYGKNK